MLSEFQFSGTPQKHGLGCTCVLCLPRPQQFRQPEAWVHSPRMRCSFSLRGERLRQPEAWAPSPRVRRAFSLRGPSTRHRSGVRKSLDRNQGPVFCVGGGGFSGAEFALFPSPLLPTSSGTIEGSSLEFLSPFVLRTAGSVFQLVNFSLLSHSLKKAPSDCSQGLWASPYPKQCRPLLSVSSPLAGGGCGRLGYFSAGSCF